MESQEVASTAARTRITTMPAASPRVDPFLAVLPEWHEAEAAWNASVDEQQAILKPLGIGCEMLPDDTDSIMFFLPSAKAGGGCVSITLANLKQAIAYDTGSVGTKAGARLLALLRTELEQRRADRLELLATTDLPQIYKRQAARHRRLSKLEKSLAAITPTTPAGVRSKVKWLGTKHLMDVNTTKALAELRRAVAPVPDLAAALAAASKEV